MSFDLTVSTPNCPADLKTLWEQEFLALGFDVEIYLSFPLNRGKEAFCRFGLRPLRIVSRLDDFGACVVRLRD